jgi:2-methylaconitate cis-trans-isomerase PrpF
VPYIGFVSPPAAAPTLAGETLAAEEMDLAVRFLSSGQPHRALPLTASLCTAVAARIAGSVVAGCLRDGAAEGPLRLGMPSGVLTVGADVAQEDGAWVARAGSFYRTARRLFDGRVWIPG